MLSLDEALDRVLAGARPLGPPQTVPLADAGGRVLARSLASAVDVPPLDNAQMDGYAVRCSDIAQGGGLLPVRGRFAAGQGPGRLQPGCAARIFTGAPIPEGCDAVVMQEDVRPEGDQAYFARRPDAGQWIRRRGSDLQRLATVLEAGQVLGAVQLGMAAAAGAAELAVAPRPRVRLLCTGDELALPGETLAPGRIYNSNRYVLVELLRRLGCEVGEVALVGDTRAATLAALAAAAADADLLVTTGGVSVGEEDHVRAALAELGDVALWQVAMKPGKPLAFGHVGAVPVLGLPGNPVSSFVTFALVVRPFLLRCMGVGDVAPRAHWLRADFSRPADPQRREFLRVRINAAGGIEPFGSQNSALLSSLHWADALADIPAGQAVEPGQALRTLLLGELTALPG